MELIDLAALNFKMAAIDGRGSNQMINILYKYVW